MSYALKYILEINSRKYNNTYTVNIYEDGYSGSSTYKNVGAGKIILRKNQGVIQYTTLKLSINSDSNFEYLGFFQYNNTKYKVELQENATTIWTGFVIAESYQENYINPPYEVVITATDRLNNLGSYTFSSTGIQSRLQAINTCLQNTGLSLGYSTAIDLYEENMDDSRAFLDEAKFYGQMFDDDDCETVLKQLLPFGATITQHNNRWLIRRPLTDAQKTHLLYTNAPLYEGTQSGETVLQMGAVSEGGIWPHGSPLLTMQHAWSKVTFTKDYGKRNSFLDNYDFSKQDVGQYTTITDWSTGGTQTKFIKQYEDYKYLLLSGYKNGTDEYITQTIDIKKTTGYFVFHVNYDVFGWIDDGNGIQTAPFQIKMKVYLDTGAINYYLTETGWKTTNQLIEINAQSSIFTPDWKELKIITDAIPADGTLYVQLYFYDVTDNGRIPGIYLQSDGVAYKFVNVYTSDFNEYPETQDVEVTIREDSAQNGTDFTLKPTDIPNIDNSELIFSNGNFYFDGVSEYYPTSKWKNNSGIANTYDNVLAAQLLSYYGMPRQRISGCNWRGQNLHLNAVAQHQLNNNRVFVADYGEWDIYNDTFNINWVEQPESASGTNVPWILEDAVWGDYSEIWDDTETWEDTDI